MDAPDRVLPRYGGESLVNLMASLMQARGAQALHATLDALPPARLAAARNIVLLVIDGLGDRYLMRRGAGSALARSRAGAARRSLPCFPRPPPPRSPRATPAARRTSTA
jgi:hypothetical protein